MSIFHILKTFYLQFPLEDKEKNKFKKQNKKRSGTSLPVWFLTLYSINWPNVIAWVPLLWDIGQYAYCNCLLTNIINFKTDLSLLIQPLSNINKKSGQKLKNIKNKKSYYNEIKCIFIIFKGLLLKQIKPTFLDDKSLKCKMVWRVVRV